MLEVVIKQTETKMKKKFRVIAFTFLIPMLTSCLPEISELAADATSLPPCKTFAFSLQPKNVTVTPLLQQGDRDFSGNGPTVNLQLILENRGDHLFARFYMHVEETDANGSPVNDGSRAEAWSEAPLWFSPEGIRITDIFVQKDSSYSYRDSNQDVDVVVPIQGPVAQFHVIGDTSGADIGSDTQAVAVFRTFEIELQQTVDCE